MQSTLDEEGLAPAGQVLGTGESVERPATDGLATEEPSKTTARPRVSDAALALGAFALALIGQFYFKNRTYLLDGAVFFVAAAIMFLTVARHQESAGRLRKPSLIARLRAFAQDHPVRTSLLVVSLALVYTAVRALMARTGNASYWDIFTLWAVGWLCYLGAFFPLRRFDVRAWLRLYKWDLVAAVALTAVAAFLRFWQLGAIPNVVSGDEGQVGLLAVSVLKGESTNMLATVFGNSTLYLFLIAETIKLFGANALGLRVMGAVGGVLSVPALYVLARSLFNRRVAFTAAALLAVSHIHTHFSRVIVGTGVQDGLFAIVVLYLLATGLQQRSTFRLALCGAAMGLHLYIYMGGRLLVMFVPVYILALLVTNPKLVRDNLGNLVVLAGALLLVSAPMGYFAIKHPDDFMARANQVGVIQSGWLANETKVLHQSQYQILANLVLQAFLTVNYNPATAFYNSSLPMLDYLTGALFILGLAYATYKTLDYRYLLLNGWFWSGVIVGGALVVLPGLAAYRILIIFPAVCLFVAIAFDRLLAYSTAAYQGDRLMAPALAVVFIVLFSFLNIKAYWGDYASSCRYEDVNTRLASFMGQALGQAGKSYTAYLLGYPRIWYGVHRSVDYLSGTNPITDVKDPMTAPTSFASPTGKMIFFLTPERSGELPLVEQSAPGGQVRQITDCGSPLLTIYQVDGLKH